MELTLILLSAGSVAGAIERALGKKVTIAKTEKGAPYLKEDPHFLSISHKDNYLVVALSDAPVGVDIEKLEDKPSIYAIARRYFPEGAKVADCTSFYRSWTRREAYGKLLGVGINKEVMATDMSDATLTYLDSSIHFWEGTPVDGYMVTVASHHSIPPHLIKETYHGKNED